MPENIGENPLPSEKMEPTLEPVLEGEVLNLETGTEKEGEKTEEELSQEELDKIRKKVLEGSLIHNPGFKNSNAGLGYIEQILSHGIIPKQLAIRAKIKRSEGGFDPTGTNSYHSDYHISAATHAKYPPLGIVFSRRKGQKSFNDIADKSDVFVRGRIKPKDIKSIEISSYGGKQFLEKKLVDAFKEGAAYNIQFVIDIIDQFRIELSDEMQENLRLLKEQDHIVKKLYLEKNKTTKDEKSVGDIEETLDKALNQQKEMSYALMDYIVEHSKFKNIVTVKDYLIQICKKFRIPLVDSSLNVIWPEDNK